MPNYRDLVDVAASAAEAAAAFIRSAPRPGAGSWDRKAAADFVTDVDTGAERLIRTHLLDACPDSTVLGEELGGSDAAEIAWIVDPLDGTTNYLHGYPAYAVSIGVQVKGKLVAGVVVDVDREVRYEGHEGARREALGAREAATALSVSGVTDPTLALLGTGFPFKEPAARQLDRWNAEFLHLLRTTSGIRRAGAAALDLVDVAQGRLDAFWEYGLAPWDVAAGIVLVREAGGRATDLQGRDIHAPPAAGPIVAGNPGIHAWLLGVLNQPLSALTPSASRRAP